METATATAPRTVDGGAAGAECRPPKPQTGRLAGFGALVAAYNLGLGTYLWRRRERLPERIGAGDLVLLGVSSHKLSRLITKDKVTAPLRAPFAEPQGRAGPGEVSEEPRPEGSRQAVGELITCPYCMGQWVATALAIGLVEAPKPTRFLTGLFSAIALSDFLQFAYRAAEKQAD